MKRFAFSSILTLLVLSPFTADVRAEVPTSMNIQGRITDTSGAAIGERFMEFTFQIFDAPAGGSLIWLGELQDVYVDLSGLWNARIGAFNPLTEAVFSGTERWLEVTVGDSANLPDTLPRIRLNTAPYAFRVAAVDGASGGTITSKVSIGPGHTNTGINAFVAGESNETSGARSTVGGGSGNIASESYATVGGGQHNTASHVYATVGGGSQHAADAEAATIAGGNRNQAYGEFSAIVGGFQNRIGIVRPPGVDEGRYSFIGCGYKNQVEAQMGTVSGGEAHTVWEKWGTIGGGDRNQTGSIDNGPADTGCQTIAGGSRNLARSAYSAVGGGRMDSALGLYSTVPGGHLNAARGAYSFAAGRRAKADHTGAFVWGDSTDADFSSTGENQFLIRATGGVGIGETSPQSELDVNGFITTKDDLPFSIKQYTAMTEPSGLAVFPHGIVQLDQKILDIEAWAPCGPSCSAKVPNAGLAVDGPDLSVDSGVGGVMIRVIVMYTK